jgi:hypothetical protein
VKVSDNVSVLCTYEVVVYEDFILIEVVLYEARCESVEGEYNMLTLQC